MRNDKLVIQASRCVWPSALSNGVVLRRAAAAWPIEFASRSPVFGGDPSKRTAFGVEQDDWETLSDGWSSTYVTAPKNSNGQSGEISERRCSDKVSLELVSRMGGHRAAAPNFRSVGPTPTRATALRWDPTGKLLRCQPVRAFISG